LNRLSPCETKGMMNSASKRRHLCPWEWLYFTLAPKHYKSTIGILISNN
jgi:hypothetical protein